MKINLNFEYNKLDLKEVVILMPKNHPNVVSFLTPILGLYGINVKDFITEFENKTRFVSFDVILPILVKITKIKTFEMRLKTPQVVSVLSNTVDFSRNNSVTILHIYKLALIKSVTFVNHKVFVQPVQRIYIALRKYLSLIVKSADLLPSIFSPTLISGLGHLCLKSVISNFFLEKIMRKNCYGFFVSFNNAGAGLINNLKTSLLLLGLSVCKLKSKFLSILSNCSFVGSVYYISSPVFSNIVELFRSVQLSVSVGSFFVIFYRYNNNLMPLSFFRDFFKVITSSLKKGGNILNTIRSLFLNSVKMVYFLNIRLFHVFRHINDKLN